MRESLSPELLVDLQAVAAKSTPIPTLSTGKPNWVVSVTEGGVRLETEASRAKGLAPQLVPAWMLNVAWRYLRTHGTLENQFLVSSEGLNVKRSSAVCALLAQLPQVEVVSHRPIVLRLNASS